MIAGRWERCRELGIDPCSGRAPGQIELEDVEARLAREALGQAGRDVLNTYARLVEGSGHVIVLADGEGRILYSVGLKGTRDKLERINFMPGGLWAEHIVGPNGVGTPLALGRPELIFGTEHYCQGWQPWVCYGAPVRDPDTGLAIGVVDITGPARSAHIETMALAIAMAKTIEQRLQLSALELKDTLRSHLRDMERRWPQHGLLLVNDQGRVIDGNHLAAHQLSLSLIHI